MSDLPTKRVDLNVPGERAALLSCSKIQNAAISAILDQVGPDDAVQTMIITIATAMLKSGTPMFDTLSLINQHATSACRVHASTAFPAGFGGVQ